MDRNKYSYLMEFIQFVEECGRGATVATPLVEAQAMVREIKALDHDMTSACSAGRILEREECARELEEMATDCADDGFLPHSSFRLMKAAAERIRNRNK